MSIMLHRDGIMVANIAVIGVGDDAHLFKIIRVADLLSQVAITHSY